MPNSPKTPITSYRLSDEDRERIKRVAEWMGTTHTEAIKRMAEAMSRCAESARKLRLASAESAAQGAKPKTLANFLLARYAEEESAIPPVGDDPFLPHGQHWSEVPFRGASASASLADIAAKREVVIAVSRTEWCGYAVRDVVLELLAAPYSDHPDYRDEWAG